MLPEPLGVPPRSSLTPMAECGTFTGVSEMELEQEVRPAGDFLDTSLQRIQGLCGGCASTDVRPGVLPASVGERTLTLHSA